MIKRYNAYSSIDNAIMVTGLDGKLYCNNGDGLTCLQLIISDAEPQKALIMIDGVNIRFSIDTTPAALIAPAFIYRHNDTVVSFASPQTRCFLTCQNTFANEPEALTFSKSEPGASEQFVLVLVDELLSLSNITSISLERFLNDPFAEHSLTLLNKSNQAAFEASVELLTDGEMLKSITEVMHSDRKRLLLTNFYSDDMFICSGAINNNAPEHDMRTISCITGFGPIAGLSDSGDMVSTPFAINAFARKTLQPKKSICILATARNEGPYILEWVAYYHSIGIEDIFIYFNDCDDGTKEIIIALNKHGYIKAIENNIAPGESAQKTAYAHALSVNPDLLMFEWCMIIDLDEYFILNANRFSSISSYLSFFKEADAIAVNWRVSTANENVSLDFNTHIFERCNSFMPYIDPHIKSIIRPRDFISSHAHAPISYKSQPFRFVSSDGGKHHTRNGQIAHSRLPVGSHAWINHFMYRSVDEFLMRWTRNRGDAPLVTNEAVHIIEGFIDPFVTHFLNGGVKMNPAVVALSVQAKIVENGMLKYQDIAKAFDNIKRLYSIKVERARKLFLDHPNLPAHAHNAAKLKSLIVRPDHLY